MIRKFNLLTPGREESAGDETIDGYDESISPADNSDSDIQKEARQYVAAVGVVITSSVLMLVLHVYV